MKYCYFISVLNKIIMTVFKNYNKCESHQFQLMQWFINILSNTRFDFISVLFTIKTFYYYSMSMHWLIIVLLFCFIDSGTIYIVRPIFIDVNMTSSIIYHTKAHNHGICGMICFKHEDCESFVYNEQKQICQCHNQRYNTVVDGQGHKSIGCKYFTQF